MKPLGIKVLSVLALGGGILYLLGAAGVWLLGTMLYVMENPLGFATYFYGLVLLVLGIGYLAIAYGLWHTRSWAWYAMFFITLVATVMSFVTLNVLGLVLGIVILLILLRRPVVQACDITEIKGWE